MEKDMAKIFTFQKRKHFINKILLFIKLFTKINQKIR